MITIKEFLGYDLHTSKVAFEYDDTEVAFIHDFFILKRRVYINGEQVFSRFSQCLGFFTDAEFRYKGDHYRIVTRTMNYLSFRQDVTLWVNGVEVGRKTDPFYAALSFKKMVHAIIGPLALGMLVGMAITSVS